MESQINEADWDQLQQILDQGDTGRLNDFLADWHFDDTALAVSRMDEDHRRLFLSTLDPEVAAELLECMSNAQAVALVGELEAEAAASIVQEMQSDVQADVIGELSTRQAEAILENLEPINDQTL